MTTKSFIKKLEIALNKKGITLYYPDGSIKHPKQIVSELCNNSVSLNPIDLDNTRPLPPLDWGDVKPLPPIHWEDAELLPPVVDRTGDCWKD